VGFAAEEFPHIGDTRQASTAGISASPVTSPPIDQINTTEGSAAATTDEPTESFDSFLRNDLENELVNDSAKNFFELEIGNERIPRFIFVSRFYFLKEAN